MSVLLTVHDERPKILDPVYLGAYYNLIGQVTRDKWSSMDNVQKHHTVDQLLKPYNGRLHVFEFQHIVLEFDTLDDHTQFLLTWS